MCYGSSSMILLCRGVQVKHERVELLQHPLIYRYINYKWWRVSFPLFLATLLLYLLFLIFLTSFALSVPRPGPQSIYCEILGFFKLAVPPPVLCMYFTL